MKAIYGGMICDGTGGVPEKKTMLIDGEFIIGFLPDGAPLPEGAEKFDASGLLVCPGFIDSHAHSDLKKLIYPELKTKLLQGVTTEVLGNCGSSGYMARNTAGGYEWDGFKGYIDALAQSRQSVNSVCLCGHNTIRYMVMKYDDRPPTAAELDAMKGLIRDALDLGAAGFSTGLVYLPGKYSDTEEVKALASCLKGTGKVYASHIRGEGDTLLEAVDEAIAIAKAGDATLEISHLKTIYPRNFGKIGALMEKIENARAAGMRVFADRYPYIYSCTGVRQVLPSPYDKIAQIADFLKESDGHFREVVEALKHSPRDLATTIVCEGKYRGCVLEDAPKFGMTSEELAATIIRDEPNVHGAFLSMSEGNMRTILSRSWVSAGSDGMSYQLDNPEDFMHPRAAGTFPLFFRIVSELCGVAEAVRRMTSLPADVFGIQKRGILKEGYFADVAIFDGDAFNSVGDFHGNDQAPIGMRYVLVAGNVAYDSESPSEIGRFGRYIPISNAI
ncbi:MAG: amidohydrolase family protein [Victivallales bacterium]|nr:amidohydrolase family protein [Victivallales bacterium]